MTARLSALVLCGGSSSRMGRDKALLLYRGRPLVHLLCERLATVADPVRAASGRRGRLGSLPVDEVEDAVAGGGPLAAIVPGLESSPHPLMAVVAVDMPHASPAVLELLANLYAGEHAVVPVDDAGAQVLHALYSTTALPALRAAADRGERSVRAALADLDVRYVTAKEWRAADPEGRFAVNLNRPEDLALYLPTDSPSIPTQAEPSE